MITPVLENNLTGHQNADGSASTGKPSYRPPIFSRSPRHFEKYPDDVVEILPPPAMPSKASGSLLSIALPVMGVFLSIFMSILVSSSRQGTSSGSTFPLYALVSAPTMLLSAGLGFYNWKSTSSRYEKQKELRNKKYKDYLISKTGELDGLKKEQEAAILSVHPDFHGCLSRAEKLDGNRLWERSPHHSDFLALRLGAGNVQPTFSVKPPPTPPLTLDEDNLYTDGTKLSKAYQTINDIPISLPLTEVGCAGFIGPTATRNELVRSVLVQIATHHAPNEVKLIIVNTSQKLDTGGLDEKNEWKWTRWLPHTWRNDRQSRYYAEDIEDCHEILMEMESLLAQRRNQKEESPSESQQQLVPAYVFVFTDRAIWTGPQAGPFGPFLEMLLNEGPSLGAYGLFVAPVRAHIPKACGAIISARPGDTGKPAEGTYEIIGPTVAPEEFLPDKVTVDQANRFARALAPIRLESLIESTALPGRVTIADLFEQPLVIEVDVASLWGLPGGSKVSEMDTPWGAGLAANSLAKEPPIRPNAWHSLKTPIGLVSQEEPAFINLQEAGRELKQQGRAAGLGEKGFGCHALIGGTTGTGKTQFLQTMILLMCANYRPDEINFVLIDYKGGDLAAGLERLPHLVGSLANLDEQGKQKELIQRLFMALEVEIQRRKNLLSARGKKNINEYMLSCQSDWERLPHLFVVIDEFAEMIQKNPVDDPAKSIMKRLLSIAAIGRSIGVHLILATQNPGTIVGDDLRNNINTRICLRMGTREASQQILRRADAFEKITKDQVGRAYIQVGNNDIFNLVQVAWGGAPDLTAKEGDSRPVRQVLATGRRVACARPIAGQPTDSLPAKVSTQIEALAEKIRKTFEQGDYVPPKPVWLPQLPASLSLNEERGVAGASGWDGSHWLPSVGVAPIIGRMDHPAAREQSPLRVDLTRKGHLIVYGSPGSGKTTLLQTLLTSLALDHSPRDVQIYILDLAGHSFNAFETMPHLGALIGPNQPERARRLISYLLQKVEERKRLLGNQSLHDYRRHHPGEMPDLVLLLDGYMSFKDLFITTSQLIPLSHLISLVSEGGACGIHLVVTSNSVKGMDPKLADKFSLAITYEQYAADDYFAAVGRTHGLALPSTPGRGLIKLSQLLEFQTALIGEGIDEDKTDRDLWLGDLFRGMRNSLAAQVRVEQIPELPAAIPPLALPAEQADSGTGLCASLGRQLSAYNLAPIDISLDAGVHAWLAGPQLSGRTTLLQSWLLELARSYSPDRMRLILIDPDEAGLSLLSGLRHTAGVICQLDSSISVPAYILQLLQEEQVARQFDKQPEYVIAIDDVGRLKDHGKDEEYKMLAALCQRKNSRVHLILSGQISSSTSDFGASSKYATLTELTKRKKTGLLIGAIESSSLGNLNVKLPTNDAGRASTPGMGYVFKRGVGEPALFASGQFYAGGMTGWIEDINKRWKQTPI